MKKIVYIIALLTYFNTFFAQDGRTKDWSFDDKKTFESANALFNKKYYTDAYEKYKSLFPNHEKDIFLKFVTGVCAVYMTDKSEEAEALLTEVKEKDKKNKDVDYYFALLYHRTYQFDKSTELANALLTNKKITPEDKAELERLVFFSKNGKEVYQNPVESKIENLGSPINTENAEYAPVIMPDEETIIFTYRGAESNGGLVDANNKPDPKGDYNEDIFLAKKVDKVWQKPTSLAELNTIENDAVIALSPDGQQLFIFKYTGDNGDIYVCKREGDKYGLAEKLRGDVNTPGWEGSVSMSTDQKKLYFASDKPGGFGGKDLYVATKNEDGSWGNVKNLGDKINTKYDEDAPFISPDSRALVFSSEGHNSIGDFDLFVADWKKEDSSWQAPRNLGYPINTTGDDLFYVLSPD
jgi:tetratricopeptide (TPR) repeat protein